MLQNSLAERATGGSIKLDDVAMTFGTGPAEHPCHGAD